MDGLLNCQFNSKGIDKKSEGGDFIGKSQDIN
jgi:hypothetical protein